jgi:hypothetical protein
MSVAQANDMFWYSESEYLRKKCIVLFKLVDNRINKKLIRENWLYYYQN